MLGYPQELANKIINYTRFPIYLDDLQNTVVRRVWRSLAKSENSHNLAKWDILPIGVRQRFWYRFVMYDLILAKIVGIHIYIEGEYLNLGIVDNDDFDECLMNLEHQQIDIEYFASINMIKIAGIRFYIVTE